jgi:hypothetical protein
MPKLTMEERKRRFEEYQRTRTPEDIRIEALEDEDDDRFIEQLDPNEPFLPVEELWKALGLQART